MQLTGNSFIKRFLSSLSAPRRLALPTPCGACNLPCTAPGLSGDHEMETQRPCKPPYRRRARRPGPAASSTPGSRLSLPGPGRARRRSAAPAAPGASARGPSACTALHSRSRGSTPPRCTGELENRTEGRSGRKPGSQAAPGHVAPSPRDLSPDWALHRRNSLRRVWVTLTPLPRRRRLADNQVPVRGGWRFPDQEGGSEPGTHPSKETEASGYFLILPCLDQIFAPVFP